MEGWYVAKIKTQKEACLMTFLEQWGVEAFYPRILSPGRRGETLQALFPSYMFFYLDPLSSIWPVVRWAPGMCYFLSLDDEPVRVPQSLIDYLKQRTDQWNHHAAPPKLSQGDKVVVLGGPFVGIEGVFQRHLPSRKRCSVLLEVVGRLATVELPEWDIQQVSPRKEARRLGAAPAT